jgi:hypothetical protein
MLLFEKLIEIEKDVEAEKEKSRECRSAIKKTINSLHGLLNGEEDSEEEKAEAQKPMTDSGGNNDDSK